MILDSEECNKALSEYKVENDEESLAVQVLLAKDEDVIYIPQLTDLDDDKLHHLSMVILKIRNRIGIKDES